MTAGGVRIRHARRGSRVRLLKETTKGMAVLVAVMLLAGCGTSATAAPSSSDPVATKVAASEVYIGDPVWEAQNTDRNWVTPAVTEIGKTSPLEPGESVTFFVVIHNGSSERTIESKWAVGTEMNETSVPIELKGALANADPASVVSVASDNPRDKLYVRAYDPERILLTVGGFVPAEKGPVIEQWALTRAEFAEDIFGVGGP